MRRTIVVVMTAVGALGLAACEDEVLVPTAAVGDCIQTADLGSADTELTAVSCDESHDAQVFALVDLDYSGEFDLDAIVEESNAKCLDRFAAFVGIDYNESALTISSLHPTQLTWGAGDTETICIATSPEMVSSSFEDSGF